MACDVLRTGERFRLNHPNTVLQQVEGLDRCPRPERYAEAVALRAAQRRTRPAHRRTPSPSAQDQAADGDLWKPTDTAADIAEVMISTLTPAKAERTAREILKKIKERKAST